MKKSAGILLYRQDNNMLELFLVHPGGPFWKNKDIGSWSIPKGELNEEEDALNAARREVEEETGVICTGNFIELAPIKMRSGKLVYAWALQKDIDATLVTSNNFEMEWPPRSGLLKTFPEIDKAGWFTVEQAKQKINPAQVNFIDQLVIKISL